MERAAGFWVVIPPEPIFAIFLNMSSSRLAIIRTRISQRRMAQISDVAFIQFHFLLIHFVWDEVEGGFDIRPLYPRWQRRQRCRRRAVDETGIGASCLVLLVVVGHHVAIKFIVRS